MRINAPRLPAMPKGGAITWSLLIDQDSVGGHDPTILFAPSLPNKLFWLPSTRSTFEYITDDKGHNGTQSADAGQTNRNGYGQEINGTLRGRL